MGFTLNAFGKPEYNQTPQTVLDLQAAADFAFDFANVRVGTLDQRNALVPAKLKAGMLFIETDTGDTYEYTGSGWVWVLSTGAYQTVSPNSGWNVVSGSSQIRYRRRGNMVEVLPQEYTRSSNITVGAAANVNLAVLPVGFRPPQLAAVGSGTVGVAGNLGASRWYINEGGTLFFQSMVASGTMASGGGPTNHVLHGPLAFQAV